MNYSNKRKLYFYFIILTFFVIVGLVTVIWLLNSIEEQTKLALTTLVLFISLLTLLFLKRKFDFYDFITKYERLVSTTNDPVKSNLVVNSNAWLSNLSKNDFVIFRSYNEFSLYYKFSSVISKSKKSKTAIIVVVINEDIKFTDVRIEKAINDFEDKFYKPEKFKNHIILHFKNTPNFNDSNIQETQNIDFTKRIKNHYVIVLNVLYSLEESKVYFINSNNFNPNHYYSFAVNEVKKLI